MERVHGVLVDGFFVTIFSSHSIEKSRFLLIESNHLTTSEQKAHEINFNLMLETVRAR